MKISELEDILKHWREGYGDLQLFVAGHPGEIGMNLGECVLTVEKPRPEFKVEDPKIIMIWC